MKKEIVRDREFLHRISEEIPVGSDVKQLVRDLIDTLNSSFSGVGLAAPQIGVLKKAFLVRRFNGKTTLFLNPTIEEYGREVTMSEGCLSVATYKFGSGLLPVSVTRKSNVNVTYYDENWQKRQISADGFFARIIQHEYDHLIGYLCVDRHDEQKHKKFVKTYEEFITKNNYILL
jgi:peptide deformylase